MFSHVTVGTNDLPKAGKFYDAIATPLGLKCHLALDSARGYGPAKGRPQLWVTMPLDRKPATVGNGVTVGLEVNDRPTVDAFYKAAMGAGGKDEGPPGLRTHYHPNYYAAYVRDLDGNKLCVVCHKPA
jgi:catechol 2,3-dioxygenase-like lactoylglutathione lyase family enzyme